MTSIVPHNETRLSSTCGRRNQDRELALGIRRRRWPQADSFNRMLDGSSSKEPPRPYSEAGTHQHKQVGMVKVPSGDGSVCV